MNKNLRSLPLAATAALTALTFVLAGCTGGPQSASSAGSTATSATASSTDQPSAETKAIVRAYQFPGGMIGANANGDKMYSRVEGLIAVPSTPGPHPTVVFAHGSYPSCLNVPKEQLFTQDVLTTPWEEGCGAERVAQDYGMTLGPDYLRTPASWAYLAQELAKRGFVVVVPDMNAKESLTWGAEPEGMAVQTNLAKLHLDIASKLSAGEDLGLPFAGDIRGKVDTSSTYLVGHSSGGGYAVEAALENALPGLKGVVAIEPNIQTTDKAKTSLVPSLLIGGQCDEQVALDSLASTGKQLAQSNPQATIVSATIPHATHIGMLFGGGSHRIGQVTPSTAAACADSALLPVNTQRDQAAQLTASFLEQVQQGAGSFKLPSSPDVKVTVEALTKGTQASVVEGKPARELLKPKDVKYDVSEKVLLPAKPKDLQLSGNSHI